MPEPMLGLPMIQAIDRPLAALAGSERESMLSLLQRHFDGVNPDDFVLDLETKQGALLLYDTRQRLRGFSTYLFYDAVHEGRSLRVAYFGDTVVDKEAWGSPALPGAVIRLLMAEAGRVAPLDLYTLLICSGYRTYRFLPFFCQDYAPGGPGGDQGLLHLRDALASRRFPGQFDLATGVARLSRGAYALKAGLAEIPAQVDPVTAFFLAANPGWAAGDELVCVAKMSPSNLTAVSRRLLKRSP